MKSEKNKQGQPTYLKIQNKGHKKDGITTDYNKQYFHVMFKPIRGGKEKGIEEIFKGK